MAHFCRGSATCQVRLPDDVDNCGRHEQTPLRIGKRAYGPSVQPLVDVLVQLYDWSLERRARQAAHTKTPERTSPGDADD